MPKGIYLRFKEQYSSRSQSYNAVHKWLISRFGKANYCEGDNCKNKSKVYEWALLKGHEYRKIRSNFHRLCKACHYKYDGVAKAMAKGRYGLENAAKAIYQLDKEGNIIKQFSA